MDKNWASVGIAALFEVGWVIGMKHAVGPLEITGTVIAVIASFYLMIRASRALPVGTVYAVFVGLGTAGTVVAELVLFEAPVNGLKLLLIALLLAGVTGLKLLSPQTEKEAG